MTQTKKLVYGTQHGLDKAIETHTAKGWKVGGMEELPRGCTGRFIYIAHLKRQKQ